MIATTLALATVLVDPVAAPSRPPSDAPPPTPAKQATRASPLMERKPIDVPAGANRLTLPQLFELLRDRSPRFRASQARADVARARRVGARVYPNPIFNFQVLHLISGYNQNGFGTYTVFLQQPILVGGQRIMRKRAAVAAEKAAEAQIEATFHELAAEGRHLFVGLLARQERKGILFGAIADLERIGKVVAARHASGAESRYDVARIDLEVAEWRAASVEAEAEIRDAAGRLGVLLGRPRWRPHAIGELSPTGIEADAERLWPDAQRTQPEIRAAIHAQHLAERELAATRREGWPSPTIGFGIVGIDNFPSMSALGGVVLPLPIFDWGQGPVARARAEARVARLEKDAVVAEMQAELERSIAVLEERKIALSHFRRDILARTPDLQQMAEDAYVTGQASILELIDAIETRYELQLMHHELLEHVIHAEVDVDAWRRRHDRVAIARHGHGAGAGRTGVLAHDGAPHHATRNRLRRRRGRGRGRRASRRAPRHLEALPRRVDRRRGARRDGNDVGRHRHTRPAAHGRGDRAGLHAAGHRLDPVHREAGHAVGAD
jgi:cobalt-zinc-cadmium efflux system outer membrane protein